MKRKFIETENYIKLVEAFANLEQLDGDSPKIGLGYGKWGRGKTHILERAAANHDVIILRADQVWTKSSVLEILRRELEAEGRTTVEKFYSIVDHLTVHPHIIIIDEVDTILRSDKIGILEIFRDIHDRAGNIIFFIGMEESNSKFKKHEHYYSRITKFVKFSPPSKKDIEKFCELSDVKIEADVVDYFHQRYANMRVIRVFINRLEDYCEINAIVTVNLQTFKESGAENG